MVRMTQFEVDAHQARVSRPTLLGKGLVELAKKHLADEGLEKTLQGKIISDIERRGWMAFYNFVQEETNRPKGEWDVLCIASEGRKFLIECKTRTGKVSKDQQAVHYHAKTLGHTVHVVRSFSQWLQIADNKL